MSHLSVPPGPFAKTYTPYRSGGPETFVASIAGQECRAPRELEVASESYILEKALDIFCNKQIGWLSLLSADSEEIIRYNRKSRL